MMSDDPAFNDVSWSTASYKVDDCCINGRSLRWDDNQKTWIDQHDGSFWSIDLVHDRSCWSIDLVRNESDNPNKEQTMFAVGEEVVCINDKMTGDHLKEGKVYRVTSFKNPTESEKAGGMTGFVTLEDKGGLTFTADRFLPARLGVPKADYSNVDFSKINRDMCS